MTNYITLDRSEDVAKDVLINNAFKKFDKQNVDKNGNYIKYSDLENNFDGVTQMYEGLNDLEDALIDYIEVIQTVKGIVKDKLKELTSNAFEKELFGAPSFVANNKIFWGQDRLEYAIEELNLIK